MRTESNNRGKNVLTHTPTGKFAPGNGLGGRTKGARDKAFARVGPLSIKGLILGALSRPGAREKVVNVIRKRLTTDNDRHLGYLQLSAQVFDKLEPETGKVVHFHLHTNVDFAKMADAALLNNSLPPVARRVVGETNGHGG